MSVRMNEISIRILVNDFKTCFDFYSETIGLEVFWGDRNSSFASFKTPGTDKPCISMFLAKHQGAYQGYVPLSGTDRTDQAVYVIPSENVDADYARLKARGVAFMGEPQTIADWYMRCVYFRDPEGNLFEICRDSLD
jgi:predicted enzyme related to lactoylglutathione lyase